MPSNPTVAPGIKLCKKGLHRYNAARDQCPGCNLARYLKWKERHPEKHRQAMQDWGECSRKWYERNAEYDIWYSMIVRCTKPSELAFRDYGARGITVCERWLGRNGYRNFLADMGRRPSSKHEIDRKNNDGNYEPGNCHWVTRHEQSRNKRTNRNFTYQERTQCLRDWSVESGIHYATLWHRLNRGYSIQRALEEPINAAS